MLARDLSKLYPNATFVVDVKSTGLFKDDPVLIENGVTADYWKTGHSYIKRRVNELGALAASRNPGISSSTIPSGAATMTASSTAIHVAQMLDRNPQKTMAELYRAIPQTWGSPTMAPKCADEEKYAVVDRVTPARFKAMHEAGEEVAGQPIRELVTVNGVRVVAEDGTWGLVRASSNKPELVVVVEKPRFGRAHARHVQGRRCDPARKTRRSAPITSPCDSQQKPGHRQVTPLRGTSATLRTGQGVSSERLIVPEIAWPMVGL